MTSDEHERERMLDALLDTLDSPKASPSLRARVMAAVPPQRPSASLVRQHPWWSGVGLVGAAGIGAAAGALCMSLLLAPLAHTTLPGSPDGALSFRQSAFVTPTTDTQEQD